LKAGGVQMPKEKDWREEANQRYKDKASKGRFKLVEGENTLRILPRMKAKSKVPFLEYLVHREVGPNKRFVRCGKTISGEGECWLCDHKIPSLEKSESSAKQKMAASLQPKEQFVVQVAVVDSDSGKMTGPYLWTVSTGGARSLAARLLGVLRSTKRDYIDPEKGYNLTIERTGTGKMDTVYGAPTPDEEPSEVPEKILNKAKPFSELIPAYSEEQQKAAYFGQDDRDAGGGRSSEEEEEPVRKKGKKKRDEEDETEDEETEDESEEEETEDDEIEEKPKKKKGKKDADEEDEDESEEEESEEDESEDEDEEPVKKGKKKKKDDDEEDEESEEEEETEDDTEETEDDEEEEERPKKGKKKKDADEEDEDEESGEEEEESEDEEETEESEDEEDDEPKAKKKKKKVVDEEDEDEEPEEKPKKKKKHGKK